MDSSIPGDLLYIEPLTETDEHLEVHQVRVLQVSLNYVSF